MTVLRWTVIFIYKVKRESNNRHSAGEMSS